MKRVISPKLLFVLLFASLFSSGIHAQITLVLQPGPTTGKDVAVIDQFPNASWHTYPDFIAAAWTNNGSLLMRSFIDFDISMIPPNATILSAHLSLYCNITSANAQLHSSLSGSNQSELRRVVSPWVDSLVTWNTQPVTDTIGMIILAQSTSPTQDYLNINVTPHIQFKHTNPTMHHGFMIRLTTEVLYRSMIFASSNHTSAGLRPRLEIVYDTVAVPVTPGPCPSYSFWTVNICHRDSVFLQGAFRNTQGIYYDTLLNAANNDSIVVTALYVHEPSFIMEYRTICDGDSSLIHGTWQHAADLYSQSFPSMYGCDSTSHVMLNITNIDKSVGVVGNTLTASTSGANYQWIDCKANFAPITGATSQSFTTQVPGSYAVIISKDGCTDISPCIDIGTISAGGAKEQGSFVMIPNPVTHGELTLLFDKVYPEAQIRINTIHGEQVLAMHHHTTDRAVISVKGMASGMYMITVTADGMSITKPFVIR